MIVNIGSRIYEMTRWQSKAVLESAKRLADCNIYAIEKDDAIILLYEKYEDSDSLNKAVKAYEEKGFKVYWKDEFRKNN
nr:MAG TPA: hypothetical protein [Bacteriophage sp.]